MHTNETLTKPVCVEPRTSALNASLPAAELGRRPQASIDICCPRPSCSKPAARRCGYRRQDRRTDTVPFRRRSPLEAARRQNHCRYLINVINRVPAVWDGSFILLQFRPTADMRQLRNAAADRPRFVDSSMTVPRHSMT